MCITGQIAYSYKTNGGIIYNIYTFSEKLYHLSVALDADRDGDARAASLSDVQLRSRAAEWETPSHPTEEGSMRRGCLSVI